MTVKYELEFDVLPHKHNEDVKCRIKALLQSLKAENIILGDFTISRYYKLWQLIDKTDNT